MAQDQPDQGGSAPAGGSAAPANPLAADAASGYSVERIAAAKDSFIQSGSLGSSLDSIRRSPCFKQAVLGAALVGTLLATHRFKEGGTRLRCASDGFLGFLGVFQAQWYLCRKDEHERREAVRRFYANQVAMQQGRIMPGQGRADASVMGAGSDGSDANGLGPGSYLPTGSDTFPTPTHTHTHNPTGTAKEEWETELEALVRYDLPEVKEGPAKEFTMR